MSVDTLMKNVYTFADIVHQAGGDSITRWNDKSIHNAFNWANYCQRVYSETVGRPYRAELDRCIKALSLYVPSPCCLDLNLDALQHANILLLQTLVENPLLPCRLLQGVVDFCVKCEVSMDSLVKVCAKGSEKRTVVNTFEDILDHLGVSSEDCRLESQAETLLTILTSLSKYSNNRERYHLFVSRVLKHLTKDTEGWKILRCLMSQGKGDNSLKEFQKKKKRCHTSYAGDCRPEHPSVDDIQQMVLCWISENQVHHI
ncbi:uncharacterized protein LOC132543197 [Ylistrum balloti]|uniref:uncharacterized protein LOC132543197 n=1 Tax=Ylistrum balloti TaxID=509963 RepID=UPI002905DBD8|nr:uncharacterized protein LOC132543197 [Ylistrum balloti]